MWESIVAAALPILAKFGMWAIENFVLGEDAKKKNRDSFQKWIDSHKKDANTSANQHQSYQDQLNDLEKPKDESNPNP